MNAFKLLCPLRPFHLTFIGPMQIAGRQKMLFCRDLHNASDDAW